jgi:starch-binding outer membrane protein, SusD/RagB family
MRHTTKLLALVGVALLVPLASCNDPLRVSIPDIVQPGQLGDSASLGTVRAGVLGDFSIAYTGDHPDGSGGTEGVIMYGGLLADEWINSETFPTRIEVDARTIAVTNADVDLWFRRMHQARNSAEKAAAQFAQFSPTDPGHAEMLTLAGLTYVFLAETWCSGVPISHLKADGGIDYGVPLTTHQILDTAIARFDAAVAATTDPDMTAFARVAKARALIDSGGFAAAGALVATVPTSFVYIQEHSENTDRQNNGVFNGNFPDQRYAVADAEGANGFPFRSVPDRRTTWIDPGITGFDGATELWTQQRYGSRKTPITVATGVEARLIEAEAALQAGDTLAGGQFLAHLNQPRTNADQRAYFDPNPFVPADPTTEPIGPLPALTVTDITAAGGAVKLLFAERARWLWFTAHRLGDMRRLVRPVAQGGYGLPTNGPGGVFPSGPYFKVNFANYGVDVNFPIPITEKQNPNFTDCLDRNP